MFDKYTIGIDFGTQSGRAVLVRVRDGKEVAVSVMPYPHGVITGVLPTGEPIPPDFALQHPKDYLRVLEYIIQGVMEEAKVRPQQVIALGIATTASTILPVLSDGTPLCFWMTTCMIPTAGSNVEAPWCIQGRQIRRFSVKRLQISSSI